MIPYLNMNARVIVGKIRFENISSFHIEETVKELGDTASIILPRHYKKLNGKSLLDYISTGDKVEIYAGYNGKYHLEFEGFLKNIGSEAPMELTCDDMFYPHKQNEFTFSYATISLKKLLEHIMPGYEVECPDMKLVKFQAHKASSFRIMKELQKDYGLFSRLQGKKLIVGFSYSWDFSKTKRHKLHKQKNVKSTNLQWKKESDYLVRVEVTVGKSAGKDKIVSFGALGKDAVVNRITMTNLSEADAKQVAKARYKNTVYNGFTGDITSLGTPRTHAGDSVEYENDFEPDKNGAYLIERVVIDYNNMGGFSRKNYLSYKI
ncbi:hypothetical protein CAP35_13745 [Chitinophagaceae bacterium IBVUCB1]|nr:hypothetical protein CAP35_13745 [Chitinophagaceae bacterium IBVUCB1]